MYEAVQGLMMANRDPVRKQRRQLEQLTVGDRINHFTTCWMSSSLQSRLTVGKSFQQCVGLQERTDLVGGGTFIGLRPGC